MTNALFNRLDGIAQYIDALISYGAMSLFATSFVVFSSVLVNNHHLIRRYIILGVIVTSLSVFPNVLAVGVDENAIITTQFLGLYALWLVVYFMMGIVRMIRGRSGVSPRRRQQITTVLVGIIITFIGAGICNLILPLFGNYQFVVLGPAFSVVFVAFFGYTIIKHHLFDIRRTLVRLIAYCVSVGILGGGIGYAGYMLFSTARFDTDSTSAFIGVGLVIAALFPVTKRLFDFATRRIFLSSEYDTQVAIDKMTAIYSSATSVERLKRDSCHALADIIGSTLVFIVDDMPKSVSNYARNAEHSLVVRDDIEDDPEHSKLLTVLQSMNIAACTPLIAERKTIGYLCFSDKANGTSYSIHDAEFIDIAADELAIALQNAERFAEIRNFNDELQSKIRSATSDLRQSNTKLRAIDATKDEFISMASHQLRTPLTSIKGYISMLIDGDLGELQPAQKKALEEAYSSSQRMVYLIGDFLNLSRLQTGRFELELANVSLPGIIQEEIAQLRASARSRNVELHYEPPSDFPDVPVDENKLRQVMMNFIDNAIYYAKPSGGEVTVSLLHHPHHVSFRVRDNGIGVPSSERPHLFTKFYRAANARKARPDGTGIGLYMAKKVVVAHGGSIIFESCEGEGSTFGFRLPLPESSVAGEDTKPAQ